MVNVDNSVAETTLGDMACPYHPGKTLRDCKPWHEAADLKDGTQLYAWQVQESDGRWSMIGVMLDGNHTPLIHRDPQLIEAMRPLAEQHAAQSGQPLRLMQFIGTEVAQ
jgi:hypothetical protein